MKNKLLVVGIGVLLLALLTGFLVYKSTSGTRKEEPREEAIVDDLEPLDPAIAVTLTKAQSKANTMVLSVIGMGDKYTSVAYELSYDSAGIVQGVTSKPIDVTGKDSFVRDDIYLGTCSRNVCRPHPGVTKITVVLEFTSVLGKRSQFSKEFEL